MRLKRTSIISGNLIVPILSSLILCLFAVQESAVAQILLPQGYEGKPRISNQDAILAFHHGKESLALEARYEILEPKPQPVRRTSPYGSRTQPTQPAQAPLDPPAKLGWVIPVPPGAQEVASPADNVFEDLFDWLHPSTKANFGLRTGRPKGLNRFNQSMFSGVAEPAAVTSAAWTILPGTGEQAVTALEAWATEQELTGLLQDLVKDYATGGWTFAVTVVADPGMGGSLGPVHFLFPSDAAKFPLRFQSGAGEFDLNLYLFTEQEIETRYLSRLRLKTPSGLRSLSREAYSRSYVTVGQIEPPASLVEHFRALQESLIPEFPKATLRMYVFEGDRLNGFGQPLNRLTDDLIFAEPAVPTPRPAAGYQQQQRRRPDGQEQLNRMRDSRRMRYY